MGSSVSHLALFLDMPIAISWQKKKKRNKFLSKSLATCIFFCTPFLPEGRESLVYCSVVVVVNVDYVREVESGSGFCIEMKGNSAVIYKVFVVCANDIINGYILFFGY